MGDKTTSLPLAPALIIETIEVLKGGGPSDLVELTLALGAHLLLANGNASSKDHPLQLICDTFRNGSALAKFEAMLQAQGVSSDVAAAVCRDPWCSIRLVPGTLHASMPMALATVACDLGAGHQVAADPIDFGVGLQLHVQVG